MKNLNYKALIFIKSSQCVWSSLRYQDMASFHKLLLQSFQARSNRSAGLPAYMISPLGGRLWYSQTEDKYLGEIIKSLLLCFAAFTDKGEPCPELTLSSANSAQCPVSLGFSVVVCFVWFFFNWRKFFSHSTILHLKFAKTRFIEMISHVGKVDHFNILWV